AQIGGVAVAPPCAMVIFGAAGDLTKRLVVPALYNLTTTRQLPNGFQLVGVDRAAKSTQEWRAGLTDTMKEFIDHEGEFEVDRFLGKETVLNIMVLPFANCLCELLWSRQHIYHVQITAAETVGVEHRGKFYEKTGALRDMVPNHVFQLLVMTAMEPPISFDAD